ncbi:MAG: hypothetical protein EVB11_06475 [Winogradskyella sp.]|nr:MAG: hypothetical protein EVB11_06475 [Winogradskyella sp.]
MEEQASHMVVNWLYVENQEILVGVTDNDRWEMDTADGMSGADAATLAFVTINDDGKTAPVEKAGFHCWPGNIDRKLAMSSIYELFEIAWEIKNNNMEHEEAREKFFGKAIL